MGQPIGYITQWIIAHDIHLAHMVSCLLIVHHSYFLIQVVVEEKKGS